jgi:hypothetical protein
VPVDLVVAIPTFIGSLLSFLASLTVIVLQVANPPRRHFRHSIIINLLASGAAASPQALDLFSPLYSHWRTDRLTSSP